MPFTFPTECLSQNSLLCSLDSDTANTARKFFSEKHRESVLDLFKVTGDRRKALGELLARESVILRVMSSKQKVFDIKRLSGWLWNSVRQLLYTKLLVIPGF